MRAVRRAERSSIVGVEVVLFVVIGAGEAFVILSGLMGEMWEGVLGARLRAANSFPMAVSSACKAAEELSRAFCSLLRRWRSFCGLCMRSFWGDCDVFLGGVVPFGGHERSLRPLGVGIPDCEILRLTGLGLAMVASSVLLIARLGEAIRVTCGDETFCWKDPKRCGVLVFC